MLERIKNLKEMADTNKVMITFMSGILMVLLYLFYYYSYRKQNFDTLQSIDYPDKVNLTNLKTCSQITEEDDDTILADYYIASSFNTACLGNQRYGHVSLDMIETVLRSGARYIELEICQENLGKGSKPVIATGDKTGSWINSENVLSIQETFSLVSNMAFVKKDGHLNYPLFIYLNLKTEDKGSLDMLADTIKHNLGKRLLELEKYHKYPIAQERICKLLNKIIIFSSEEHIVSSKLTELIIPSDGYLHRFKYNEIDSVNGTPEISKDGSSKYNKVLSRKAQEEGDEQFKEKYPTIDAVRKTSSDYLRDLQTDDMIIDVLSKYNKAGLSIVIPHKDVAVGSDEEADVFSVNYDITNAMAYGCQFISVNYQVHDEVMDGYIDFFHKNSFILKPKALRFHKENVNVENIMNKYPIRKKLDYTILEDFHKKMSGKLVAIQSYTNQDLYLTKNGDNFKFTGVPIKNKIRDNGNGNGNSNDVVKIKFPIDKCFLIIPSRSRRYKNGIMFATANNLTEFVSTGSDYLYLSKPGYNEEDVKFSTFLPIASKCGSDTSTNTSDTWEGYLSFATTDKDVARVIGNFNGYLKEFRKTNNQTLVENTCFHIVDVPNRKFIELRHYSNKYLKINKAGELVLGTSNIKVKSEDANNYKFEIIKDINSENGIILGAGNGKYFRIREDGLLIADLEDINISTVFDLDILNQHYVLKDSGNRYLVPKKGSGDRIKGLGEKMHMKLDGPLLKPAVKDSEGKLISVPVYGESLKSNKYYRVKFEYQPL